MPHPIGFTHLHVIHLYREEKVQRRLPYFGQHVGVDRETVGGLVTVAQLVQAGLRHV